jgi:hypothetical protein
MRVALLAVVLALAGCTQGYIQLPPFPDGGLQDATTFDVIGSTDVTAETGEGGPEDDTGTDAPADGGSDSAGDSASNDASDAPADAADAGDAAGE